MTVSELAELRKLSKAYISQVKNGKRPPSKKLLESLTQTQKHEKDFLALFLESRAAMGVSPKTMRFYRQRLFPFTNQVNYIEAKRQYIEKFLGMIPPNHNGLATRHASFRAIKTFYRWLSSEHNLPNPLIGTSAPILGKPVLPSLSADQVSYIINTVENPRNKAIIALFTESGLRLSELSNIKLKDIDWGNQSHGQGQKRSICTIW